jgi:hypothetical protein
MVHSFGDDFRAAMFVLVVLFLTKGALRWFQGGRYAHYADDI